MRESDELASAFTELEAHVRETSRLPGLAAAQSEAARRRRGRQVAGLAAAAVVVALASAAPVVRSWIERDGVPSLGTSPSVTTTPTPTPTPSVPAGPTPATVLGEMAPPERIRNATIDLPNFEVDGCPSGRLEFRDRAYHSSVGTLLMESAAVGDLNGDGDEDIVVSIRCAPGGSGHVEPGVQVLAYSGPALTLLGPVPTGGLTRVASVLVRSDGVVELGMARASFVEGVVFGRFRWNGSGFERIDGADVPGDALPVVVVSAEPAAIQLAPGGPEETIEVTIRNDGPASALPLYLTVVGPDSAVLEVEGLANSATTNRYDLLVAAPPPGQATTVTLRIALPFSGGLPGPSFVMVSVDGGRVSQPSTTTFTVSVREA